MLKKIYLLLILVLLINSSYAIKGPDYYEGYTSAVIEDFFPERNIKVTIKDGILTISYSGPSLSPSQQKALRDKLNRLKYYKTINIVRLIKVNHPQPVTTEPSTSYQIYSEENDLPRTEFLPGGVIYKAPIADPKWPTFYVGYQNHQERTFGKNIFALSFGDNLALMRHTTRDIVYEVGIQAGLSGLIDFSKAPSKLINSDYFVGAGLSILYQQHWQMLFQFSHMSSHLGDEILLSNANLAGKRLNLSYEAFKGYLGYQFESFRPFIGLGYLVDRDPGYIKPLTVEGGIDYVSADTFLMKSGRFIFGVYSHHWQENNFKPSFNIRPGVQFENCKGNGRFLRLMLDYGYGNSRHGQFYAKKEHYIGLLLSIAS